MESCCSEAPLPDQVNEDLLWDGDLSEIDDYDGEDIEFESHEFDFFAVEENIEYCSDNDVKSLMIDIQPPFTIPEMPVDQGIMETLHESARGGKEVYPSALQSRKSVSSRAWQQIPFQDKKHSYPSLPIKPVRTPIEYFRDYFDTDLMDEMSRCTNLYYLRATGRELLTTGPEIAKLFGIHIIMGCIPYPRLSMYWRAGTNLNLISNVLARDRFQTVRNALHLVDSDLPTEAEKNNPLWKIQPLINKVKDTCNKLERVVGYYSIGEQMIPFTYRPLRQVVKNKNRQVGLKNFVLTTSQGLMLDFEIYLDGKTKLGNTSLGFGPSIILHLIKTIPPGSCVHHGSYFTTVPLIEEMEKIGLHSTGTIMRNRILDHDTMKLKEDSEMSRGETQQFVCKPVTIVKWKEKKKTFLLASNCTGSEVQTIVKRWDKETQSQVEVSVPKIIQHYNAHKGGVDLLKQQTEYYRTFIKSKKWPLKVIVYFLDLALVNSWRLYKNDCKANGLSAKDTLPLLDFRMDVANVLTNIPERPRNDNTIDESPPVSSRDSKIYRPANPPSVSIRYDGYDHLPFSDDIKSPRSCRMEGCSSRSKIKCVKCDVYLCLSRDKDCYKMYHKK